TLSSDALEDRPVRVIAAERVPPEPVSIVPRRTVEADADVDAPPRIEPRRMTATVSDRPMPLPTLDASSIDVARSPLPARSARAAQGAEPEPRETREPRPSAEMSARPQP